MATPAATFTLKDDDRPIDIGDLPAAGHLLIYELPAVSVTLAGIRNADDPAGRAYEVRIAGYGEGRVGPAWYRIKTSNTVTRPWTAAEMFNNSVSWACKVRDIQAFIDQAQATLLPSPEEVIG